MGNPDALGVGPLRSKGPGHSRVGDCDFRTEEINLYPPPRLLLV